MACERCGASTQRGTTLCRDCASDPPRRVRVAIGLMAVYWGAFTLFTYGMIATTPSGPITRLPLLFASVSGVVLVGLWQLRRRTWGWALIWWTLFFISWPLAVYVSPHFTVNYVGWVLPIPAFVWFVYYQHDLYLDDRD